MSDASFPTFDEFYRAANNGRAPLPWQLRLAGVVATTGWPNAIEIPTGLGKTTCLDIAVWALASQANRPAAARTLPTRVWYVVNRRLLVDAAFARGLELEDLLTEPESHPDLSEQDAEHIRRVGDALREIRGIGGAGDRPFVATRLRGAADLGVRAAHPAQPALVFATVPMFASSWLFRGYASSRSMHPVDAAHAGIDSLVLLDEAHLAQPLQRLVHPIDQCDIGDPATVMPVERSRPLVVSLTATGDAVEPFGLDADDLANDIVQKRLNAHKPTRLVSVNKPSDKLAPTLADELTAEIGAHAGPVAAVVFTNTARGARAVFNELTKRAEKETSALATANLELLTGRMRSPDAAAVRDRVLHETLGAPAGRDRSRVREQSLVVVATQTLEVGADLDFDILVTETSGARSLIQRFGRLNRLGETSDATAVIVHPAGQKQEWPVYGTEPATVWDRLETAIGFDVDVVDLQPGTISEIIGEPGDHPPRTAELLPAHLWEWAKTTTPPPGEAPVEPFFEGFASEGPRLTLCWRATPLQDGERLVPSVDTDETIELPLREAKEVLADRFGERPLRRLAPDRVLIEEAQVSRLRPSDIVILDVDDGLHDKHGWNPDATETVDDLSLERWPGIPLDPGLRLVHQWGSPGDRAPGGTLAALQIVAKSLDADDDEVDVDALARHAKQLVDAVEPEATLAPVWAAVTGSARERIDYAGSVPMLMRDIEGKAHRSTQLIAADAFDDLSAAANVTSVGLADHLTSVGEIAGRIGTAVGLSDELVAAVEAAGRFHDLGKADSRFQRWLDPRGEHSDPVAKSNTPRWLWRSDQLGSGWPSGGRHEALSARLIEAWLDEHPDPPWDPDLVLHLSISHHGFGRPLVAPVKDVAPVTVTANIEGEAISVRGDLGEADWDQPARFRRCCERYGYWGLALLEAVVRQADHIASSQASNEPMEVA